MRFIKGTPSDAAAHIADRLQTVLGEGRSVLWLISGGSNIDIQISAMKQLSEDATRHLTIMPVDERYGPYNHLNSNAAQMRRGGFEPKRAEWIDILEPDESVQAATRLLNDYVARKVAGGDYVFATLGIGADGHTAGILPYSPALASTDFAITYQGPDYQRITLCADALVLHCDEVCVCAFGASKQPVLAKLIEGDDERDKRPADLLRGITNCTVYNDTIDKEVI